MASSISTNVRKRILTVCSQLSKSSSSSSRKRLSALTRIVERNFTKSNKRKEEILLGALARKCRTSLTLESLQTHAQSLSWQRVIFLPFQRARVILLVLAVLKSTPTDRRTSADREVVKRTPRWNLLTTTWTPFLLISRMLRGSINARKTKFWWLCSQMSRTLLWSCSKVLISFRPIWICLSHAQFPMNSSSDKNLALITEDL